jgi:NADH-quinone oxidoreductase subunit G
VLRHFQGEIIQFDDVLRAAAAGRLQAVYLAAGYPPGPGGWIGAEQAATLGKVPRIVLHDLLPSPASEVAHYIFPAASFAEKEGTFVNHAGLAQAIHRAVHPLREARTDGQVFLDLLERRGLVHAPTVRAELAREVPYFAPLATAGLGESGLRLGNA